jgi:hypothetical protein
VDEDDDRSVRIARNIEGDTVRGHPRRRLRGQARPEPAGEREADAVIIGMTIPAAIRRGLIRGWSIVTSVVTPPAPLRLAPASAPRRRP